MGSLAFSSSVAPASFASWGTVSYTHLNALIHRDYIVLGSEVHIDMFDDPVEITSPGGMFGGVSIQEYDIYSIRSMRRNPVIADLFHRMKYMERRGSGLRKIHQFLLFKPQFFQRNRIPGMHIKMTFFQGVEKH